MSIFVIGMNHKTAPVNLREKVYFSLEKLPLFLQDLLNTGYVKEAVLLSTCNRSELYCHAEKVEPIFKWFCQPATLSSEELKQVIYIHEDQKAIKHMMAVACGMDSMMVGETQILGQMKTAFSESCTAGAVGTLFHRLFREVFAVAKEIRTTTAIGACPVSVASAAVYFAKEQVAHFSQRKIALVGAGETTVLLARYLKRYITTPLFWVNRSSDKVLPLVREYGGFYHHLDELPFILNEADIVFSATGSAMPIITSSLVSKRRNAHERPLLLIDVAVPRDIEATVGDLDQVKLYCIDDLKSIIEANRHGREHAAVKALELIETKSKECFSQLETMDKVTHTIRAYRSQIEEICQIELLKARQQLGQGGDPDKVLEIFANAFMNKLLHAPSVQLRQAGEQGRFELLHLAKQLFAIPDQEAERI